MENLPCVLEKFSRISVILFDFYQTMRVIQPLDMRTADNVARTVNRRAERFNLHNPISSMFDMNNALNQSADAPAITVRSNLNICLSRFARCHHLTRPGTRIEPPRATAFPPSTSRRQAGTPDWIMG